MKMETDQMELLAAAQELHSHTSGACFLMDPARALALYEFLRGRLEAWQKGPVFSEGFDNAVRYLCEQAVVEYGGKELMNDLSNFVENMEGPHAAAGQ